MPALGDLAVSIYLPGDVAAATTHDLGLRNRLPLGSRRLYRRTRFTGTTTQSFHFLTTVEVRAAERAGAIVTLGESVTDGVGSTPDTNQRWTNLLAERLQDHPRTSDMAVLNAGIGGNRIRHDIFGPSGLSRFDRDALVQSGATDLIVSPGNTRHPAPGLDRATRAERQRRPDYPRPPADHHSRTCDGPARIRRDTNPVDGFPSPGFWTTTMEVKRQLVNRFIRTSGAYLGAVTAKWRSTAAPSSPRRRRSGPVRSTPPPRLLPPGARRGDRHETRRQGRGVVRGRRPDSESFTYDAVSETGNKVVVVAAEDYTGASPAQTSGPNYPDYYLDALKANGDHADVYDVDAQGRIAPDALGVLSHYDAVVWDTGRRPRHPHRRPGRRQRRPAGTRRAAGVPRVPERGRPGALRRRLRRPAVHRNVGTQLYDPKGEIACNPLPAGIDPRRCLPLSGSRR